MISSDFNKSFNRTKNAIKIGIGIVFAMTVVGIGVMIWGAVELIQAVDSVGLKGVVDAVWNGSAK
ncbi:hypothetical protein [Salmonella phage SSBI34]|nr:hypothetical protein [Salmonella phage SSBI34]